MWTLDWPGHPRKAGSKIGHRDKRRKCGSRVSGRSFNISIKFLEEAVSNPETSSLEKPPFKTAFVFQNSSSRLSMLSCVALVTRELRKANSIVPGFKTAQTEEIKIGYGSDGKKAPAEGKGGRGGTAPSQVTNAPGNQQMARPYKNNSKFRF